MGLSAAPVLGFASAAAAAVLTPAETRDHIGEEVVVEGHLDSAVCSAQACLLSFEPGFSGLVVAIPGDELARFPDPKGFQAHRLRVRGLLTERGGRPRLEVHDPAAIEVVDAGAAPAAAPAKKPEAEAGRRAKLPETPVADGTSVPPNQEGPEAGTPGGRRVEVQVEGGPPTGNRLDAREAARRLGLAAPDAGEGAPVQPGDEIGLLRQDLAAIAARLGQIESRLDELEGRLVDVEGVVAEAAALLAGQGEGAGTGLPSYVVPGQTSPSLHRVGRGWTVERVVRLLGEPLQVTGRPPGPFTWYYDGGRALTVDERGRVLSAVGF